MYPAPVPDIPPASNWTVDQRGISLRMRMEPAAPIAGQPVRFVVDASADVPCCALALRFGDTQDYTNLGSGTCSTDPHYSGIVASHTYPAAGAYKVSLVAATLPCQPTMVNGQFVPGPITGASITGCVGIGPGPEATESCPAG